METIRQKTIYIPDAEKSSWTKAQLVTFMCTVDALVAAHMDECKAEARRRVGTNGGKLVYKDHTVAVTKQGAETESVGWKALAEYLLKGRDDRDELISQFSTRKAPAAQKVTMK